MLNNTGGSLDTTTYSARRRKSPPRTAHRNVEFEEVLRLRQAPSIDKHPGHHQYPRRGELKLPTLARATAILEADHMAKEVFRQSYVKALHAKVAGAWMGERTTWHNFSNNSFADCTAAHRDQRTRRQNPRARGTAATALRRTTCPAPRTKGCGARGPQNRTPCPTENCQVTCR